MRVFVTGSGGFAGRWLGAELAAAGHEVVAAAGNGDERLDVRDAHALAAALDAARPEAIVHLAAIASATEAGAEPESAFAVTVGGTVNLLEAVRRLPAAPPVLVVGSSEVYGAPTSADLPLREDAPLRPRSPYALSKAAQEGIALAYGARHDWPLVVVRPFNHTGPGQRPAFVVPAIARRVLALQQGAAADIPVGNLDVMRDFTDVRDVVRAYRLVLEALSDGGLGRGGRVFNVCSGEAVSIRRMVELLCRAAGVEPRLRVDPALVRSADPPLIRGDAAALAAVTGWRPETRLEQTLADVWQEVAAGAC